MRNTCKLSVSPLAHSSFPDTSTTPLLTQYIIPPMCKLREDVEVPIKYLDTILRNHPHIGIMLCGDLNHLMDRYLKKTHTLSQLVKMPTRGSGVLDMIYAVFLQGP